MENSLTGLAKNTTDTIATDAKSVLSTINDKLNSSGISGAVKQTLIFSKNEIEAILSDVFVKSGIIDQSQVDSANTALANAKKSILAAQAEQSKNNAKFWIGVSSILLIAGGLILRAKNK